MGFRRERRWEEAEGEDCMVIIKPTEKRPELVGLGLGECVCCGIPAEYTIMLAGDRGHYYIPNQITRAVEGTRFACIKQVPFCRHCMREIEDNLRATIQALIDQGIKGNAG
jgi:hypothetical protein